MEGWGEDGEVIGSIYRVGSKAGMVEMVGEDKNECNEDVGVMVDVVMVGIGDCGMSGNLIRFRKLNLWRINNHKVWKEDRFMCYGICDYC